jgi:hypothetical protein
VKLVPVQSSIESQNNAIPKTPFEDNLESDFVLLSDKKEEQRQLELRASSRQRRSCEATISTRNNNNRTSGPPNVTTESTAMKSADNINVTIEKKQSENETTKSVLDPNERSSKNAESLINIGTEGIALSQTFSLFIELFLTHSLTHSLIHSLIHSLLFTSFNDGSEFVIDESEERREDEYLQSQKLDNFPKILKNKGEVQIARKLSLFVIECSIEQLIRGEEIFFILSPIRLNLELVSYFETIL